MIITEEEIFALRKLFHSGSIFDTAVIDMAERAEVMQRKATGVGFFSRIRFPTSLPDNQEKMQWDWNFEHRKLKHGGSFIGCYVPPNTIELEAVVHDGKWPEPFEEDAFLS